MNGPSLGTYTAADLGLNLLNLALLQVAAEGTVCGQFGTHGSTYTAQHHPPGRTLLSSQSWKQAARTGMFGPVDTQANLKLFWTRACSCALILKPGRGPGLAREEWKRQRFKL